MSDPLSDVLSLLDVESARCTRLEAGGRWALSFPAKPALKFAAALRGRCWIRLPGEAPQAVEAGDTFLLAHAPAYVMANDLEMTPHDGLALFDDGRAETAHHGGDETVLIAGSFQFRGGGAGLLLDALPPFIHIRSGDPAAAVLRGTLELLDVELHTPRMGSSLMARRLGDILLLQALRAFADGPGGRDSGAGWIAALGDPRIGAALRLIHANPGRRWTVAALATGAGLSRSGFALRFKDRVGAAPLDYVTRWRMQL
ncbi:MAG: transcriptional regulator, AraC family, partial [Chitinophagaceae bacterium]|nr:transcriptional regulator, AraC family [Chitinophagaceae bacterium]